MNADGSDIYFEFTSIGTAVRVSAIDAATGTEVTIMGPIGASQASLEQVARAKLLARLRRAAP